MEPASKFFSVLFLVGIILMSIGYARSKDLKQYPFMPVWKADKGRNGLLMAGAFLTCGSTLVLLLVEVF
jgi:hypothetical protein